MTEERNQAQILWKQIICFSKSVKLLLLLSFSKYGTLYTENEEVNKTVVGRDYTPFNLDQYFTSTCSQILLL